jgi:hypothetical protein
VSVDELTFPLQAQRASDVPELALHNNLRLNGSRRKRSGKVLTFAIASETLLSQAVAKQSATQRFPTTMTD